MTRAVENVRACWPSPVPDWVLALADYCDRTGSQRHAAEAIGYSTATVNQVLRNSYAGALDKVAERVRGAIQGVVVTCPVLGETPRHVCLDHQNAGFTAGSGLRVRLYRACRAGCPHSYIAKGERA